MMFDLLNSDKIDKLEYLLWGQEYHYIDDILLELDIIDSNNDDEFEAQMSIYRDRLIEELNYLNEQEYGRKVVCIASDGMLTLASHNEAYLFCVKAAYEGARATEDLSSDEIGTIFEHIVLESFPVFNEGFKCYRNENIHRDLPTICEKLEIKSYHSEYKVASDEQDGGVDIIAYKKTHPSSSRGLIYLIQCAAGKNFKQKCNDISDVLWKSIFPIGYSKYLATTHFWIDKNLSEYRKGAIIEAGQIWDRRYSFIDCNIFRTKYPIIYSKLLAYVGGVQ